MHYIAIEANKKRSQSDPVFKPYLVKTPKSNEAIELHNIDAEKAQSESPTEP